ncbi:hypothetical protein GCM10022224_063270 [Nonomuraea antimicrobica]|uniref:Spore-associated protein A n=1 Tax=Nonomuraea antimicrobica TaxID=561173 RepID=A0ABP7CI31_9ACTN
MRTRKLATLLAGAALAASTTLMVSAAPASAVGPCGSGYTRVDVYPIPKTGSRTGTLEVYYNSSAGKNCALAYGYGSYNGTTTWKGVSISRGNDTGYDVDADYYQYYAGPVYVSAPGQCIDVSGTVVAGKSIDLEDVHCD